MNKRLTQRKSLPSHREQTTITPSNYNQYINLPNSVLLSMLRNSSAQNPESQTQIPSAEHEADFLSNSVTTGSPEDVKTKMGQKLGADFSKVHFHTDSASAKKAESIGARAFTSGSDIYFNKKGFEPSIAAHELVHTIQQGTIASDTATLSTPIGAIQMIPDPLPKLNLQNVTLSGDNATLYINLCDYSQQYFEKKNESDLVKKELHEKLVTTGNQLLNNIYSQNETKFNSNFKKSNLFKLYKNVEHYLLKLGAYEPNEDSFHFGEDIVFGLDEPREKLLTKLLGNNHSAFSKGMTQNFITNSIWKNKNPKEKFNTLDKIKKNILNMENRFKKEPNSDTSLESLNPEYTEKLVTRANSFRTFLEEKSLTNSKYNIWTDYLTNDINEEKKQRWKTTSKAGLEFQLMHQQKPVYFAIEQLKPSDIIKKISYTHIAADTNSNTDINIDTDTLPAHNTSITSSEMRWLYKHRKDENVKKNLKLFDKDGNLIPSEEYFSDPAWEKYDKYRDSKRNFQNTAIQFNDVSTQTIEDQPIPDNTQALVQTDTQELLSIQDNVFPITNETLPTNDTNLQLSSNDKSDIPYEEDDIFWEESPFFSCTLI